MKTAHGSAVSYNVQTVVDSKLKLLVTYEVTNEPNESGAVSPDGRSRAAGVAS